MAREVVPEAVNHIYRLTDDSGARVGAREVVLEAGNEE